MRGHRGSGARRECNLGKLERVTDRECRAWEKAKSAKSSLKRPGEVTTYLLERTGKVTGSVESVKPISKVKVAQSEEGNAPILHGPSGTYSNR